METQAEFNYQRIASAISFLRKNYLHQPSLEAVASHVNVSPFHFQRMFKDWAGVTPKQFLQYLNIEHAKRMLGDQRLTLFDAAFETGLSGTGRLHDLFIKLEGMTPGEYKNGGRTLQINYSFAESPFGTILIASTAKGICYMAFADEATNEAAFEKLRMHFPYASFHRLLDRMQQNALFIFTQDWTKLNEIKLHLQGTAFQIKVWESLLKIPMGGLRSYAQIAYEIARPQVSRAVGSAVASNPIAFLIPCHRVIKSTGEVGEYHWGSERKNIMIGWEGARVFEN